MNYKEYKELEAKKAEINSKITVEQMMNGIPADIAKEIEEIDKAMHEFKVNNPFGVSVSNGRGRYELTGMYSTAEEAIANCPEYEAVVENVRTGERIFTAKFD